MRRGKLFAFSRFFVRLKIGRWTAEVEPPAGPVVYVCSHGNMAGPLGHPLLAALSSPALGVPRVHRQKDLL